MPGIFDAPVLDHKNSTLKVIFKIFYEQLH